MNCGQLKTRGLSYHHYYVNITIVTIILLSSCVESEFVPASASLAQDDNRMFGMECYQCRQSGNNLSCEVEPDTDFSGMNDNPDYFESLLKEYATLQGDDDHDDEEVHDFVKKMISGQNNPCKVVTSKVLQLVQLEEDTLLPIHLKLNGKDLNAKYQELKETISTIQFQKRESAWLAVEVQLRDKADDTFSFILPDLDLEFFSIPHNSIFYTSL